MKSKSNQLHKKIITKITVYALICILLIISLASCDYLLYTFGIVDFEYEIDFNTSTVRITGIGTITQRNTLAGVNVDIPETIEGYPVVAIDDYAFKDNDKIFSVEIPSTIEYIGQGAFYNCTNLTIVYDFEKCTKLKTIESETFSGCNSLKYVALPNNIVSIKEYAFKNCLNLKEINIPSGVTQIGQNAFDNCQSIEEIVIPNGIKTIEEKTFFSCLKLKNIVLPEGITTINAFAFANCYELETLKIPSTLQYMENGIFNSCHKLTRLDFPDGLLAINPGTFTKCISLSHLSIPASTEYIAWDAFDFCELVQEISIDENNPLYHYIDGAIYGKNDNQIVRYLMGKTGEKFTIKEGIEIIGDAAFGGNSYLKILNVPKSVKEIKQYAFYSSAIETINFYGTVEEWNDIEKDPLWNDNSADYTIYCTDGQISKDGKITFK